MFARQRERLIIFTRYPEPGQTKTRLIPLLGKRGAAQLQRQMTAHVASKARKLSQLRPLDVEICYDGGNEQVMQRWLGHDFSYCRQAAGDIGQRMAGALTDAFQSGADNAVLIGSDIPGISSVILRKAFEGLLTHDLVFGPSRDGGYYLIGMPKAVIYKAIPQLFCGPVWGSGNVLAHTLAVARELDLSFHLLEPLDDVDRPADLPVWEQIAETTPATAPCNRISVIIPTLNEAGNIGKSLSRLPKTGDLEVIVVDGGSKDGTAELARSKGARVLMTAPSKAHQMNTGALAASGDILVFLHADTQLPVNFKESIYNSFAQNNMVAGAFQLRIDSQISSLRFIERVANWRSRRLQMPYGDQALFVSKTLFQEVGGFPDLPIMEDYELVRRLRKKSAIVILPESVLTSPRRWLNLGVLKTWLINQTIVVAYYLGIQPTRLARWYRRKKGTAS